MVRFVHTADWQIGMKATHVGTVGEAVRAERFAAAQRVVDSAKEHGAQFIAVAGDTFEDNAVDRVLIQKVGDILAAFDGPVYLIPGNHDPLVPGSVWDHGVWKSHANLHVLVKTSPVEIDGAVLFPSPLREKHSMTDPTRWIDANQCGEIAIGIAHGSVQGVVQDDLDYPIARDAAARAGLDYLALGHWHSTAHYEDAAGATRMAYSGTHETTKFGERDSGNVLLVEIEKRGDSPKMTSIRSGGLTWESLEEDIGEAGDLARLRERIETIPDPDSTLLDISLTGVLHSEEHDQVARIDEIVRSRFLYGRIDHSQLLPRPTDDNWLNDVPVGVMREVAERLRALGDPAKADRPEYATPEVAARAMIELYRMIHEVKK